MRFQDQGIAERIAEIKHFFHVSPAETNVVGLLADVTLHIGRRAAEHKINHVLFQFPFDKAERTFIIFVDRIVERYRVKFFFHCSSSISYVNFMLCIRLCEHVFLFIL